MNARRLELDIDTAIHQFFDDLLDIAKKHGENAIDVAALAERRGSGAEGFENWIEDDS